MDDSESNLDNMRTILRQINAQTKEKILKDINDNKYVRSVIDDTSVLNDQPIDELKRILFWCKQKSSPLCGYIHIWMKKMNFYIENKSCKSKHKNKSGD